MTTADEATGTYFVKEGLGETLKTLPSGDGLGSGDLGELVWDCCGALESPSGRLVSDWLAKLSPTL